MADAEILLAQLAELDTATVSNVIELFDVRPRTEGYADARIRAAFPELPPAVGFACPATYRASAPSGPSPAGYGNLERLLELIERTAGRTIVVIQDLDEPAVGATFGEVMCGAYRALGCQALIASGAGRDFAQIRELQFPVFSSAVICSHAYGRLLDVGIPVEVGGLRVLPGDLIHADANGVTNVPLQVAELVVEFAPHFLRAESIVTDYVRSAASVVGRELLARRREMGAAIDELRRRAQRALDERGGRPPIAADQRARP